MFSHFINHQNCNNSFIYYLRYFKLTDECFLLFRYTVAKTLQQQYMLMPANVKHCYLSYLLHQFNESTIIIFSATCK